MGIACIGGRIFINFRFADDIVVSAEEEEEADDIVTSIYKTCTRYKTEIWPCEDRNNDKQT